MTTVIAFAAGFGAGVFATIVFAIIWAWRNLVPDNMG